MISYLDDQSLPFLLGLLNSPESLPTSDLFFLNLSLTLTYFIDSFWFLFDSINIFFIYFLSSLFFNSAMPSLREARSEKAVFLKFGCRLDLQNMEPAFLWK